MSVSIVALLSIHAKCVCQFLFYQCCQSQVAFVVPHRVFSPILHYACKIGLLCDTIVTCNLIYIFKFFLTFQAIIQHEENKRQKGFSSTEGDCPKGHQPAVYTSSRLCCIC